MIFLKLSKLMNSAARALNLQYESEESEDIFKVKYFES